MRANLLCGRGGVSHLIDEDTRHTLPIGQMGNYQDYLKKQPTPLRELESAPVRQHMFGNPFKTNKNLMMMDEVSGVDEVQIVTPGAPPVAQQRGLKRVAEQPLSAPPKRRKGPLSKDFQFSSPVSSPVHTPAYPQIDLQAEIQPLATLHQPPTQAPYSPYLVNGTKPANNITSAVLPPPPEDLEALEETSLNVIEPPVKPPVKDENARSIVSSKKEPSRNFLFKNNNKIDLVKSEANRTIADSILSSLNEVHGQKLEPWLPNGQIEPKTAHLPRKPETDQSLLAKENLRFSDPTVERGSKPDLSPIQRVAPLPAEFSAELVRSPPPPPHNKEEETCQEPREKQPTQEELRSIKVRNNNVRQLIYKEVKRPGRCHSRLWKMLEEELQGPAWVRKQFIHEVKQEAIRYLRARLLGTSV